MGAYHFSAKIHSRSAGASAVRAAAYRAGERLHDERMAKTEDYSRKSDVIDAAILAPGGSPAWVTDREALWNRVEARERRCDAQVAQEYEINLPREFSDAENWQLITDFAREHLVSKGRICDIAFHKSEAGDGEGHPHAHILMPLRRLEGESFTEKHPDVDWRRFFNRETRVLELRREWCEFSRKRAAELGIDLGPDWDHRSYEDRGLDIEAQPKIGATAQRIAREQGTSERIDELLATLRRNGERLLADPGLALQAMTRQQSTFMEHELARWIHKHSAENQFQEIFAKAKAQAVLAGTDDLRRERYSTQEMIALEKAMLQTASVLAAEREHVLSGRTIATALGRSALSGEQKAACAHLMDSGDLSCLIGYAGAGKSTMLAEVRHAFEEKGFIVKGGALSGIAAEKLEQGSGIEARTLAGWAYAWERGREVLARRDVLIIDEAGMIGSRQLAAVLDHARRAGAKVILVGDPEQLQAIEAGAAFRAISERTGYAELTEIWRQKEQWQRDATKELARGATAAALSRYRGVGWIETASDEHAAQKAIVDAWLTAVRAEPEKSRIILTHTRKDVRAINEEARAALRADGTLGDDLEVTTSRGARVFATGDRLIFLRNDRGLGVKNGTLGTITNADGAALDVRTDDGRRVTVDPRLYADIDHGYAVTIHKSQGVTVDQSYVLATCGFDRHLAYVALSRHRERVWIVHSAADFPEPKDLARVLSRERSKDVTTDYMEDFAQARDFDRPHSRRSDALRALSRGRSEPRKDRDHGLER